MWWLLLVQSPSTLSSVAFPHSDSLPSSYDSATPASAFLCRAKFSAILPGFMGIISVLVEALDGRVHFEPDTMKEEEVLAE